MLPPSHNMFFRTSISVGGTESSSEATDMVVKEKDATRLVDDIIKTPFNLLIK